MDKTSTAANIIKQFLYHNIICHFADEKSRMEDVRYHHGFFRQQTESITHRQLTFSVIKDTKAKNLRIYPCTWRLQYNGAKVIVS